MINISVDTKELMQAEKLLSASPKAVRRASANAINKTLTHVRANASKTIRKRYIVKAKDIKTTFSLRRANATSVYGVLKSEGKPIHLSKFKVTATRRKKGMLQPLRVQVVKTASSKPVPGLFKHDTKSFLHRVGRTSYPLRVPYGPSVPQMLGSKQVIHDIASEGEKFLNERFLHEVEQEHRKLRGK